MSGKKTIFIVLAFTIITLIFTWFFLEFIIEKYDIDRAMNTQNILSSILKMPHQSVKY